VSSAALEQTTFAQPSLGKKNSKAGDAKRSSTSIATINPEFKDLAQTWGWKMITVHEKMYPWPSSGYHPVLGLRWSKSSEQHEQDKHPRGSVGYARDRLFDSAPPSAVSRDKSVRRFAQDNVSVVSWRCKKPASSRISIVCQTSQRLWGAAPSNASATRAKRLRRRARLVVHGVKAFEKPIFGRCIRISCTGHHRHPRVRLSLRKAA
jgi:hypothetical protein